MSGKISKKEALIIVKGAIRMAQQDHKVVQKETELLEQLLASAGLHPSEVGDFNQPITEDISKLAGQLQSKLAKQAFLLALACMALVDGELDHGEADFFTQLAKSLGVGTIELSRFSFATASAQLLKVMEISPEGQQLQGKQVLDMDLM